MADENGVTNGGGEGGTKQPGDGPDLLGDCQIMLRFVLKEGIVLPDDLRQKIAQIDQTLVKLNLASISPIPRKVILDEAPLVLEGPSLLPEETLLAIHAALSRVVAPATALTLQISEPSPGKRHPLGGLPDLVRWASYLALVFAFGFVATSIPIANQQLKKTDQSDSTSTPTPAKASRQEKTVSPSASPTFTATPAPLL